MDFLPSLPLFTEVVLVPLCHLCSNLSQPPFLSPCPVFPCKRQFLRRSMSAAALSQAPAATASSCSSINSLDTGAPLVHTGLSPDVTARAMSSFPLCLLHFPHPQLLLLPTCSTPGTAANPEPEQDRAGGSSDKVLTTKIFSGINPFYKR